MGEKNTDFYGRSGENTHKHSTIVHTHFKLEGLKCQGKRDD